MPIKYRVTLTDDERSTLQALISSGRSCARKITRARILLKSDRAPGGPAWTEQQIIEALDTSARTIERTRRDFVEDGPEAALNRKPPTGVIRRKFDGETDAHVVQLACTFPPEGRSCWTLQMIADRMVTLNYATSISRETVRQVLKKTS